MHLDSRGALAAALLVLAPGPSAAGAASVHGVVLSGQHDGGAYRFELASPGWHRTATAAAEPYAFRLARDAVGVVVTPLSADDTPSANAFAQRIAQRSHDLRAVLIDAHHAEVVTRDGRPVVALVDAEGPFPVVFSARARPTARRAQTLVHRLARTGRFTWAGPDVLHLPNDPDAAALVTRANAAMAASDSYSYTVTINGKPLLATSVVRSQRFETLTSFPPGPGFDTLYWWHFADSEYRRSSSEQCWQREAAASDSTLDPVSEEEAGPLVSYGPVQAGNSGLRVVQQRWTPDAIRATTTLVFNATTGLLVWRSPGPLVVHTFDWTPITVPAPPEPVCAPAPTP